VGTENGSVGMARRPISNARYWRDLAQSVRLQATDMKDEESKLMLIAIADTYERLAERAEAILAEKSK
jgi:hypothetical protein